MTEGTAAVKRGGWLVIGVGNEWRGDDAIGLLVARDLRQRPMEGLHAVESGGDAAALIELWKEWERVCVVDAMRSGSPPGTILRLLASDHDPEAATGYRSSHALGVGDAIRLSRALGTQPANLVVYGIEGGSFEPGLPVSAEVAAAGAEVTRRILKEVLAADDPILTERGPPAPSSPS